MARMRAWWCALLAATAAAAAAASRSHWSSSDLHVMIMTHRRTGSVVRLLDQILQQSPRPRQTHVVVAQSCESPDAPSVGELANALREKRRSFGSLAHVLTPHIRDDTSFSVNRGRHGSKRNSVNNLLHGLDIAFTGHHRPILPHSWAAAGYTEEADDSGADGATAGRAANATVGVAHMVSGAPFTRGLSAYRRHLASLAAAVAGTAAPVDAGGRVSSARSGGIVGPREVIVLEDDVTLASDAFAFFGHAADVMTRDDAVNYATALLLVRPSVVIGSVDVDAVRGWWRHPTTNGAYGVVTSPGEAAEVRDGLSGDAADGDGDAETAGAHQQQQQQGPVHTVWEGALVDRVTASQRTVFKTLAWMVHARGYTGTAAGTSINGIGAASRSGGGGGGGGGAPGKSLRWALAEIVEYEQPRALQAYYSGWTPPPTQRQKQQQQLQDEAAAPPAAAPAAAAPMAFRSGHHVLKGCIWCHDYCYDHAIEWLAQGRPLLAPSLPRVTQRPGAGMTSTVNELNVVYSGPPLAESDFVAASTLRHGPTLSTALSAFQMPGWSAIAPPLPVDLVSSMRAVDRAAAAGNGSSVPPSLLDARLSALTSRVYAHAAALQEHDGFPFSSRLQAAWCLITHEPLAGAALLVSYIMMLCCGCIWWQYRGHRGGACAAMAADVSACVRGRPLTALEKKVDDGAAAVGAAPPPALPAFQQQVHRPYAGRRPPLAAASTAPLSASVIAAGGVSAWMGVLGGRSKRE